MEAKFTALNHDKCSQYNKCKRYCTPNQITITCTCGHGIAVAPHTKGTEIDHWKTNHLKMNHPEIPLGAGMENELTETYADRYIRDRIEKLEAENARLGDALTKVMLVLIEAIKKPHPVDGMALIKDVTGKTIAAMGQKN